LPGFFFAYATRSATLRMPSFVAVSGFITSTLGTWATPTIGVKSRSAS